MVKVWERSCREHTHIAGQETYSQVMHVGCRHNEQSKISNITVETKLLYRTEQRHDCENTTLTYIQQSGEFTSDMVDVEETEVDIRTTVKLCPQ